jgi:hypothetical protein
MRARVRIGLTGRPNIYNQQQLRCDRFATALAYLNGGIGWQRRSEAIHAAMRDAVGMQVLKIARNPGNGASSDMATGRRGSPLSIYRERSSSVGHRGLNFVFGVATLRHLDFARSTRDPPRIAEGGNDRPRGTAATTLRLVWFEG